jgi:Uma2 family endonuclease
MTLVKEKNKIYAYTDYLSWDDDERWELIGGEAYNMTPAPSTNHQTITGKLHSMLLNKLSGKQCTPFIAPTDVVLSEHDVVQPDILVVCDKNKITDKNIQGPPDLLVEVLFPATALKDKREKKTLYEKHGVKEYIIVDPIENYVERFTLKDGHYGEPEVFGPKEELVLNSIEGTTIELKEMFEIEWNK